jgi:hypothetical protein
MLAGACALMLGGVTGRAQAPPSAGLSAAPSSSPSPRPELVMVSPPAQRPATVPMPTPTALDLPAAPPATVPPGAVQGIEVPSPVNLPPVAVLPAPAQTGASRAPAVPWGLLAAFLATLLIAAGLTARRHR